MDSGTKGKEEGLGPHCRECVPSVTVGRVAVGWEGGNDGRGCRRVQKSVTWGWAFDANIDVVECRLTFIVEQAGNGLIRILLSTSHDKPLHVGQTRRDSRRRDIPAAIYWKKNASQTFSHSHHEDKGRYDKRGTKKKANVSAPLYSSLSLCGTVTLNVGDGVPCPPTEVREGRSKRPEQTDGHGRILEASRQRWKGREMGWVHSACKTPCGGSSGQGSSTQVPSRQSRLGDGTRCYCGAVG
jgi:hypothetical protein